METASGGIQAMLEATAPEQFTPPFPPLDQVSKPNLTTPELAYYLDRAEQTLRGWACFETGPIRARRINGRLAWSTADAKTLAGVV